MVGACREKRAVAWAANIATDIIQGMGLHCPQIDFGCYMGSVASSDRLARLHLIRCCPSDVQVCAALRQYSRCFAVGLGPIPEKIVQFMGPVCHQVRALPRGLDLPKSQIR